MKAIIGLTAGYALAIAIAFSAFITSSEPTISNVLFGEAAFALPMIISSILALVIRRVNAHRILLVFEIIFSILSVVIFVSTFIGEHDAQYQLALLFLPLIGFPAVVIAGAMAASTAKEKPTE